ncbi:hypothetical protein PHYBOEH_005576 [Phytophthora boehmeriae]|uniref:Uncharacterized protein n=1 Tax=Phytophthora boehmeriae TaxID=109152 RepID=A0A8T1WJE5_9STRA|nr:hypothetical protein PHYBOEH_005576 [Phytophthora boehmeriae]
MSTKDFYKEGAKRMTAEGLEAVSKIMAFMKTSESKLAQLDSVDRKKAILEFEPAAMFNQVHPIVFQYLATENIFNKKAFGRYVRAVYGKPKDAETQTKLRGNRRYLYHHKNEQCALYYKYLLIETNPLVQLSAIQKMYDDMVKELNKNTDQMLDSYEQAEKDAQAQEHVLTSDKKKDLLELMAKKYGSNQS